MVNSCFTRGLTIGLSVGDTMRAESEVLELRGSRSRPTQGIVTLQHRAYNQRNELVGQCKRAALMLRRPA